MFENVEITKLENGACVVTSEMKGVNSCSVCFSMPMGSRREKAAEAGWSHFVGSHQPRARQDRRISQRGHD